MRNCANRTTAPDHHYRGGVGGGLLFEELIEGGTVPFGGGECGCTNEPGRFSGTGDFVDSVALRLGEPEGKYDLRFLQSLLLFRFRLLHRFGLLDGLRIALRFRGLAVGFIHRSVLLRASDSCNVPRDHPVEHANPNIENSRALNQDGYQGKSQTIYTFLSYRDCGFQATPISACGRD